jgi:hypothetical protein
VKSEERFTASLISRGVGTIQNCITSFAGGASRPPTSRKPGRPIKSGAARRLALNARSSNVCFNSAPSVV